MLSSVYKLVSKNKFLLVYIGMLPMVAIPILCKIIIEAIYHFGYLINAPDIINFKDMIEGCWNPIFGSVEWWYFIILFVLPLFLSGIFQIKWANFLRNKGVEGKLIWIDLKYWSLMPIFIAFFSLYLVSGGNNPFC